MTISRSLTIISYSITSSAMIMIYIKECCIRIRSINLYSVNLKPVSIYCPLQYQSTSHFITGYIKLISLQYIYLVLNNLITSIYILSCSTSSIGWINMNIKDITCRNSLPSSKYQYHIHHLSAIISICCYVTMLLLSTTYNLREVNGITC